MPLIQSKSKKAFSKNVETEMKSGRPQDQSLAIAYSIKRKPKKMAKGGEVKDSAVQESRPMPSETAKDSAMVSRNSAKKPQTNDFKTEGKTQQASHKPHQMPLKHPKIVGGSTFTSRLRDLRDEEDHLQSSAAPASPEDKAKMYAKGGMINNEVSMSDAEEDEDPSMSPLDGLTDQKSPAKDEYMASKMQMLAEGGPVEEEEAIEHAASIAAAIMAKRKMMADGGQVDLDLNSMEQPNDYYHQNEDVVLKENYDSDMEDATQPMDSNEHGHDIESDKHDMVSAIRRKMKMKSPITR